jgi:SAM-dependent methyltransferase
MTATDFTTVTETWGLPASPEQLAMQYFRYRMAAGLSTGRDVLEIGCGSGMGLPYLGERSHMIVGGDYTMGLLREGRARLPKAPLVRMDAQHLPFRDASLDVILMLEMIYYVADQDAAFAECRRVLKPGGSLMVCVPNPERPDFNPSPFSTRYPNAAELAALYTRHGFEAKVSGAFPVDAESGRDRMLAPIRHFAVRYHLIPNSMRAKALVKRVLYGRLPTLGAVHDGMGNYSEAVALDPSRGPQRGFKNLYAVGNMSTRLGSQ